jgi:Fuc2NAc and GlcNAc transferase
MIYFVLFVFSLLGTYIIRWYSIKKSILDIPNERSSHTVAVPRGGGLAIISTFYIGLFYFKNVIDSSLFFALLCAIPIAIISILDDIFTLSSKLRFLIQSFSAMGALYYLGGVDKIDFIVFTVEGVWLNIIAFIAIIWLTNLYNFLDGIDGYASVEAITVGLGISLLFQNPLGLVIVVASLGFLYFNWHKASIFMGDVGSATLGFIFAVFVFSDTTDGNIYIWMVLLSLFWLDATITLIRRAIKKEKLTQAHKKHAYQRLEQSGYSHNRIVTYAGIINIIFIGCLYYWDNALIILGVNMLVLFFILKFIDRKKQFI